MALEIKPFLFSFEKKNYDGQGTMGCIVEE